jgi:dsDNA-binding SOS-regulon protein
MAKVQYTKVEDILTEGLRKIKRDNLLDLAAIAANIGPKKKNLQKLINQLKVEIAFFKKKERFFLKKLLEEPKKLEEILEKSPPLTEEENLFLITFIQKFTEYKNGLKEGATTEVNESLIEQERIKHINKRFNVRDKWLPLH